MWNQWNHHLRYVLSVAFSLAIAVPLLQGQEHRSTWVTNIASSALNSRDNIATTLDSLVANNFNSASVVVWNGGFPLFPSQTYYDVTGSWIHPSFVGRDPLREFVEEAHLRGITVYAWFEYGFAAAYGQPGPILNARPQWAARTLDGNPFQGTQQNPEFYWLSHGNKEVWDFLIGIIMEIVRNYDIDGIEFDRLRYGNVMFGYDSATVAWYRAEHNNQPPPENYLNTPWREWRSGLLNRFMSALYDSVKRENPNIVVSNAPIVYPFGYDNFLQDWRQWVRDGSLDFVIPQMYRDNYPAFELELNRGIEQIGDEIEKLVPGIRVRGGPGEYTPLNDLLMMVQEVRNRDLSGMYFWFYEGLPNYAFAPLREQFFDTPSHSPFHPPDWREYRSYERPPSAMVQFEGNWTEHVVPGFRGQTYRSQPGESASATYYFDVPASGWYTVLYHRRATSDGAREARYRVFGSNADTVSVTQNLRDFLQPRGWTRIATVYLEQQQKARVVTLDAPEINADERLITDAVAIILNRKLSPDAVTSVHDTYTAEWPTVPGGLTVYQNFPNPFNPTTTVRFSIQDAGYVRASLYDVLGRLVKVVSDEYFASGYHDITIDAGSLASGIYHLIIMHDGVQKSVRMHYLK